MAHIPRTRTIAIPQEIHLGIGEEALRIERTGRHMSRGEIVAQVMRQFLAMPPEARDALLQPPPDTSGSEPGRAAPAPAPGQ